MHGTIVGITNRFIFWAYHPVININSELLLLSTFGMFIGWFCAVKRNLAVFSVSAVAHHAAFFV
jgi:hypothetical protein